MICILRREHHSSRHPLTALVRWWLSEVHLKLPNHKSGVYHIEPNVSACSCRPLPDQHNTSDNYNPAFSMWKNREKQSHGTRCCMLGVVMLEARGVDGSIRKSDVVSFFYLFIFYHTHSKPTLFYLCILPLHAQPFFLCGVCVFACMAFLWFLLQVKLTSDIKLWAWAIVCLHVSALWLTGDLSRVYTAPCPVSVVTGSRPLQPSNV